MSEDMLTERRQWYHCFPEGTIEFNLVTRIVVVGMLGALAVLPESQHVLVINGLVGTLWFDALLIIWWAVQIGMDLETSIAPSGTPAPQARRRALVCAGWAALPTLPALLLLAPWADLIINDEAARIRAMTVLVPVLSTCFVVSLFLATWALKRLRLGAVGWVVLWLIPVLHLLALHRIIRSTQARIQHRRAETGLNSDERHMMGGSLIAADIIWLLSLIIWGVLVVRSWQDSAFTISPMGKILVILGTVMVAVFSAVQLSLMERLQQQFLGLINRKN
jgi:hypothetical protein